MKILAIDTSCDETAAAVTDGTKILSNIIWSQASAHSKFGGVMPSLAKRMHEEHIDFVIKRALGGRDLALDIDAIAVTIGPGLSIALNVGLNKAKELAKEYKKPLIPINHVESHLLSPLAHSKFQNVKKKKIKFPAYGLVVSGKNTMFVMIEKIGKYKVLAETVDDALGEALDKAARMLGLGYPGGAIFEKMARLGNYKQFVLPTPLIGQEKRMIFSYSGLKASFYRLLESYKLKDKNFPSKQNIYDLAITFEDVAFKHIERILSFYLTDHQPTRNHLLLGGGVAVNTELRKRLRKLGAKFGMTVHVPYTNKLCGDNAGMIGVCAYLKYRNTDLKKFNNYDSFDRNPKLKIGDLDN